jgi:hypothetical protein
LFFFFEKKYYFYLMMSKIFLYIYLIKLYYSATFVNKFLKYFYNYLNAKIPK